ncbi:alginate O-acetyltransferase AlgF [Echinimonas agarilytica]|uniref:Alginate biosynthesis protein AlgF n=1 Tax=Echinimonas agarilytica TaxID=1215918 RepID=A0AA42B9P1_9GAMM|nr:alginate O-acetyltransferase AlgF [Echinimonas agarilytica]MCM2681221.1 alginate O-acetyltransferase AlgF [Echinimonas agarilytica]
MKKLLLVSATLVAMLFGSTLAFAGDGGLYGKQAPANAAFFRIFNSSDTSPVAVTVAGETLQSINPLSATAYGFTESASLKLSFNGSPFIVAAAPKSVHTIIWDGQSAYAIKEEAFSNKKKARLKLFNLTGKDVSLKTADGKTPVIKDVKSADYGFRDINALNMPFGFFEGDSSMLTSEKLALKKGQATSLFLVKNGGAALYVKADEER